MKCIIVLFSMVLAVLSLPAMADDEMDIVLKSFKNAISSKMYAHYSTSWTNDPDRVEYVEFQRKNAKMLATCVGDQFAASLADWQKSDLLSGFRERRNEKFPWMNEEIGNAEIKCIEIVLRRNKR